ncbi:MAG: DUF4386 domain-containing protein [Chloroflexi bacterium]|nr:DUF4386 domain-containing protein [Chloroflexota bacterium]
MKAHQQTAVTHRRTAIATGVLFLITHVTAVGGSLLYTPAQNNPNYILGSGSEMQILLGVFLEVILALAVVGTAVALYPVVKRYNEGVALGYVGLRTLEAAVIAVGVVPLLTLITLRQTAGTDADVGALVTVGNALVALHNWTFLLGPGLVCGTNTVLMAYLMYKSHLVPRFIPILGLVGGPLIFVVNAVQLFVRDAHIPAEWGFVVIPIFAWEVTLALWLIFKGFRSVAAAPEPELTATTNQRLSAA